MQELTSLSGLPYIMDGRMVSIEWNEPVRQVVEERETLHLRETGEVDIRTLLLHFSHTLHTFLHLLHIAFCCVWMQNVLQCVLIHLHQSAFGDFHPTAIHDVRHNLFTYLTLIILGIHTIEQLHLQLCQFAKAVLVLTYLLHHLLYLWIQPCLASIKGQYPAHKCTFANLQVGAVLVHVHQHLQLIDTKSVDE